ncbi:hypothetical protein ACF0H5_015431 [Mactra antiquata]
MEKYFMKCRQFVSKNVSNVTWFRSLSTGLKNPPETRVRDVNKNIQMVVQSSPSKQPRPLVLLFGWLFARPQHLRKFADMYVHQGFDVISVQVFLSQLLRPNVTQSLMRSVLDLCLEEEHSSQPIIVHGLSVGGYLYGEVLTNLQKYPEKYGSISQRLRGQIFDSVVDFYGIPGGISRAVTRNEKIGSKIESSLEWYLNQFKSTTDHYVKASDLFHSNELKIPSIFLYSMNDVVCSPEHKERIVRDWLQKGIDVTSRSWEDAPHVSAFVKHNEEYTQTINGFVQKLGLVNNGTKS